jgi:hypothetical protein
MKKMTLKLQATTENQMIEFENEKGKNVVSIKQIPPIFFQKFKVSNNALLNALENTHIKKDSP